MIEKLYRNGLEPENSCQAVTKNKCNRCFGKNTYKDKFGIHHCLDCFQYGEINETMTLYRFSRNIPVVNNILKIDYQLTNLQKKGSNFLLDCYKQGKQGFLQAVCGAGKTEMTYQVILTALNDNKKVCFVIPRVEVLKEVGKRIKTAFPKTNISLLYEGNKCFDEANMIMSTPQQLIYFYREFDLIILDEVDAFPYAGNVLLERLVKKSVKQEGVILYMSATVSKEFLTKNKVTKHYLIPSRYHFKDMVVPEFIKIRNHRNIPKSFHKYLCLNNKEKVQTIIFTPTIRIGEELYRNLKCIYRCAFIHSRISYKGEIIKQFRNQEINFLISTTVLERGVTFKHIDVFVFCADHRVFSKESLIQISGRVGRDISCPNGKLLFFSEYMSKAMKKARNEIVYMNIRNKKYEV